MRAGRARPNHRRHTRHRSLSLLQCPAQGSREIESRFDSVYPPHGLDHAPLYRILRIAVRPLIPNPQTGHQNHRSRPFQVFASAIIE